MRTYTARPFVPRRDQRGLTLIELMVALVLGLLLLTAMVTLFANTSAARRELDRSAELHATGRYALEFLRGGSEFRRKMLLGGPGGRWLLRIDGSPVERHWRQPLHFYG